MPESTQALNSYLKELCAQAGYDAGCPPAPGAIAYGTWHELVATGYNDIDARCDAYLNWLDNKRAERLFVTETAIALSALLGGVLGIAAPETTALSYIALALGFGTTVYNSYQNSILMGIEGSTVKKIVYERRLTHRLAFKDFEYSGRADAVYSLRNYLLICTPQTILMNVNIYAREAVTGRGNPAVRDAQESLSAVAPSAVAPTADEAAGTGARRGSLDRFGEFSPTVGVNQAVLRDLQGAACITADGVLGDETRTAIVIIRQTDANLADMPDMPERNDIDQIDTSPCPPGLRNYYEKVELVDPGDQVAFIDVAAQKLQDKLTNEPEAGDEDVLALIAEVRTELEGGGTIGLADERVRRLIAEVRRTLGVEEKFPIGDAIDEQVTPTLHDTILEFNP